MINQAALAGFYGTENWHRWSPLFPKMLLTDGTKYIADHGGVNGAYWLMDAIASYQPELLKKYAWATEMQFWTLTLTPPGAVLTCQVDRNTEPVVRQEIEYTDFDLLSIDLWVGPGMKPGEMVILLPSEY